MLHTFLLVIGKDFLQAVWPTSIFFFVCVIEQRLLLEACCQCQRWTNDQILRGVWKESDRTAIRDKDYWWCLCLSHSEWPVTWGWVWEVQSWLCVAYRWYFPHLSLPDCGIPQIMPWVILFHAFQRFSLFMPFSSSGKDGACTPSNLYAISAAPPAGALAPPLKAIPVLPLQTIDYRLLTKAIRIQRRVGLRAACIPMIFWSLRVRKAMIWG